MKQVVAIGQTDYTVLVWLGDSSSTTGAAITGIVAANLTVYYARVETDNDVTSTVINMADLAALTDAHTDGGWLEVSAANQPGLYRLDLPDGVFAAGAWSAAVTIVDAGANDIAPANLEFQLEPVPANAVEIEGADPTDTIRDSVVDDATRIDASQLNTHTAITAAGIVNEWETQSQADPTGFHVNVLEVESLDATDQIRDSVVDDATRIDASQLNTHTAITAIAISDAVLSRDVANVEATASNNSLAEVILAAFESAIAGAVWTIYETDHATTFNTRTVTTSAAADPIIEVT